jgi:hypothetical protein
VIARDGLRVVDLAQLPARGALLVIGAPPLVGGSDVPARPLALLQV